MAGSYARYSGISGSGGGGGGTLTSINGATGPAVTLSAGTGINIGTVGNTITISNLDLGTVTAVTATSPLFSSGGNAPNITIQQSSSTLNGFLSSTDWNTFNNKQGALTLGNLTDVGTDGITVTGGTGAVVGSGTSLSQHVADTTHNGYLASTDWNTFNNKQAGGVAITSLTGDVTASGPGAAAASLVATSNSTLTTLSALTTASSLASIGTITSGTWNATTIAIAHGGTGQTTAAAAFNALTPMTTTGDLEYESATNVASRLPIGTTGQLLTVVGGIPAWASPATSGTVTSVSVVSANGLAGTVATATTTPAITLSTTITGILQGNGTAISAATTGNLTDAGTDGITVTGGTGAVLGTGTSLSQHVADTTHNGYLSSTDWNTFNGKQAAGNYITALTGDATATGPGSVAITFATVNGNVGTFGSSTSIPTFTVNAKGLITAASGNAVVAPAGTLSGTTLNATVVSSSLTSVGTITSGTWNGTTIAIANGGTGQTTAANAFIALSPLTTAGDLIYENNTPAPARLPIGTNGQYLFVSSGLPAWTNVSAITEYSWSGYHSSNYLWSTSGTTFADYPFSTGTFVQKTNTNFGTVTSANNGTTNDDLPGIHFSPPITGDYFISVSFCFRADGSTNVVGNRLWDDTNSVNITEQAGGSGGGNSNRYVIALSGIYNATSTSAVSIVIQSKANTGSFDLDDANGSGSPVINWTIYKL